MDKIVIVAPGSQAAEVAGRMRQKHRAIPLIAHQSNQSLLEAIVSHRDAMLLYLDTTQLEFKGGVRYVWETVTEINRLLGDDRKHMILVITWSEPSHAPGQLIEQSRQARVNLIAVGKRDADQITRLITNILSNFTGYLEKHGAIQDSPQSSPKIAHTSAHRTSPRPTSGDGFDHSATAPNSVFSLAGERFAAPPPVVMAEDQPEAITTGGTSTAPAGPPSQPVVVAPSAPEPVAMRSGVEDTAPTPPSSQDAPEEISPSAAPISIQGIDLDLLENAIGAAVHAFFRVLRKGRAQEKPKGVVTAAPLAVGATPAPVPVAATVAVVAPPIPAPVAAPSQDTTAQQRFSLVVLKGSNPKLADKSPETIRINDIEIVTTRRVRHVLEALRSTGRCPKSAAGGTGTRGAINQFLTHMNRSLRPTSLQVGVRGEELCLRK